MRALLDEPLRLDPRVTFLVGENGSGKSTLVEAIAVAAKMNPEGGGYVAWRGGFGTRASHSSLHRSLVLELERAAAAEPASSCAPSASTTSRRDAEGDGRWRTSTAAAAARAVARRVLHRPRDQPVRRDGFYILDEPEAALSVQRQLALLARSTSSSRDGAQLIVATHSPILIGYPDASIVRLDGDGLERIGFDEADQVDLTRLFLADPQRFLRHLLSG